VWGEMAGKKKKKNPERGFATDKARESLKAKREENSAGGEGGRKLIIKREGGF